MPPRQIKAVLHRQDVCELGEGPFWHGGQLWWVDIERGQLLSADEHGSLVEKISFGQQIGAAVPAGARHFLVALEREIARVNLDARSWETVAQLAQVPEGGRCNDGKCDPRGRFLIGTMSKGGKESNAALHCLHHDHSLRQMKAGTSISNGLAWTADGRTMYFTDTPPRTVYAYDYDLETGAISGERIALKFTGDEGFPDGMTIDREDRLWISFWDGGAVRCYQPKTGVCEAVVEVPCSRPTSCCFGGENLDRLFITTARTGLTENELRQQPLAGSLFTCDPQTGGRPTFSFIDKVHGK